MPIDVNVTIGGEAGQGIQTVGHLVAKTCHKAGLRLFAINDYESRIRGGHSFFQCRIRDVDVRSPRTGVDLLVAMDDNTRSIHESRVADDGVIIVDGDGEPEGKVFPVAVNDLAKEAGGKIYSNTVAAGACLAMMGADLDLVQEVVAAEMGKKGQEVVDKNREAARLGFEAVQNAKFPKAFQWEKTSRDGVLIDGAQALALGALAGDCRFAAFYPMSPATGIMVHLSATTMQAPVHVEQVEDEIAAINMVTGASFAGVRAVTATSGGGFSLMTEGLGLAAITETPVVIINAQRPGPATGLPTRTGQGDLLFVINATQDEFPRFVFAPDSPEAGFATMIRALDLADKYQVPAIVLADHFYVDSLCSTDQALEPPDSVKRYITSSDDSDYERYAVTDSGVSPRALPGRGAALVGSTGNEHTPDGHITENRDVKVKMTDKRNAKIPAMVQEMNPPEAYHGDAENLLVCWGSTWGPVREGVDAMRDQGMDVGAVHFIDLWPFPADAVEEVLGGRNLYFVEQNSTGQLARLVRQETGLKAAGVVLKYDGRPFAVEDVIERAKKAMEG
ncbi:MAG: 2-oxoacid:acceptor oxidoreductase subunit alpha [Desulfatibacillaceae bacterium]